MRAHLTSVLLVLVTALLQVSIAYRIEVGDAYPDLLMLVVSAIALLRGSISGAIHGFLAGVFIAIFAVLPLGPHALIGVLVGYAIGRAGDVLITNNHPIPPLIAGIFATTTMQIGRPLIEFLVSPRVQHIDGLFVQASLVTLISSMLAVPVFLVVRKILGITQTSSTMSCNIDARKECA